MANVYDVANFFIDIVRCDEDDLITNLKLNKLMYYAQGCFLSRTGKPLFNSEIEAWPLGPVVTEIYEKYKVCGRSPIETTDEGFTHKVFSSAELVALVDVMREFGQYTSSALVDMTHMAGTPWSKAIEDGEKLISIDEIKTYFEKNPVPKFSFENIPVVTELPADWYDPEEDAIWEEYLADGVG